MASPERLRASMAGARGEVGAGVMLVGVIGSPVAHSLSPLLHEAAFEALGLGGRWRSFAFEVAPGAAGAALEDMRRAAVRGLSVTMPHKAAVAGLVDECSATARQLDAVNCVLNEDGSLRGVNTDGEGFIASLARGAAFDPAGARCVVAGAGGAARAVVLALATSGAAEVVVVNRTPARARAAAVLAGPAGSVVAAGDAGAVAAAVEGAALVVNATPVGMVGTPTSPETDGTAGTGGTDGGLIPAELLVRGQVVADLVYAPRPTPWLRAAAARGAKTIDGLGMLVHQAAAQLVLWTGMTAPVEAMWRAAEAAAGPSRASGSA